MDKLNTIKSFQINHDKHCEGMYLSHVENNIYTYDLRFKKPNNNDFLSTASAHSIEHMFATVIRNSEISDKVVYVGPMGCRTGIYLLLMGIGYDKARELTIQCLRQCLELEYVPGSLRTECGNYLDHDIAQAKRDIQSFLNRI